jgi:hypothetical protein
MKDKTGKLLKVNANDLFSGRVKEHEVGCQCGQHLNYKGTQTGRLSAADMHKSNTPKSSKL